MRAKTLFFYIRLAIGNSNNQWIFKSARLSLNLLVFGVVLKHTTQPMCRLFNFSFIFFARKKRMIFYLKRTFDRETRKEMMCECARKYSKWQHWKWLSIDSNAKIEIILSICQNPCIEVVECAAKKLCTRFHNLTKLAVIFAKWLPTQPYDVRSLSV